MPAAAPRAVPCDLCGQMFFPASLKFHQKTCLEKQQRTIIECPYCSIEMPQVNMDAHLKKCKAAREALTNASAKDGVGGSQAVCPLAAPTRMADGRVQCQYCGRGFSSDRIHKHTAICAKLKQARPRAPDGTATQTPERIYSVNGSGPPTPANAGPVERPSQRSSSKTSTERPQSQRRAADGPSSVAGNQSQRRAADGPSSVAGNQSSANSSVLSQRRASEPAISAPAPGSQGAVARMRSASREALAAKEAALRQQEQKPQQQLQLQQQQPQQQRRNAAPPASSGLRALIMSGAVDSGTVCNGMSDALASNGSQLKPTREDGWRSKHQELIEAIRLARRNARRLRTGDELEETPENPASFPEASDLRTPMPLSGRATTATASEASVVTGAGSTPDHAARGGTVEDLGPLAEPDSSAPQQPLPSATSFVVGVGPQSPVPKPRPRPSPAQAAEDGKPATASFSSSRRASSPPASKQDAAALAKALLQQASSSRRASSPPPVKPDAAPTGKAFAPRAAAEAKPSPAAPVAGTIAPDNVGTRRYGSPRPGASLADISANSEGGCAAGVIGESRIPLPSSVLRRSSAPRLGLLDRANASSCAVDRLSTQMPMTDRKLATHEDHNHDLAPGVQVQVRGLSNAAHLNGQQAVLMNYDTDANCWLAKLECGDVKALRPEHIVVTSPGPDVDKDSALGSELTVATADSTKPAPSSSSTSRVVNGSKPKTSPRPSSVSRGAVSRQSSKGSRSGGFGASSRSASRLGLFSETASDGSTSSRGTRPPRAPRSAPMDPVTEAAQMEPAESKIPPVPRIESMPNSARQTDSPRQAMKTESPRQKKNTESPRHTNSPRRPADSPARSMGTPREHELDAISTSARSHRPLGSHRGATPTSTSEHSVLRTPQTTITRSASVPQSVGSSPVARKTSRSVRDLGSRRRAEMSRTFLDSLTTANVRVAVKTEDAAEGSVAVVEEQCYAPLKLQSESLRHTTPSIEEGNEGADSPENKYRPDPLPPRFAAASAEDARTRGRAGSPAEQACAALAGIASEGGVRSLPAPESACVGNDAETIQAAANPVTRLGTGNSTPSTSRPGVLALPQAAGVSSSKRTPAPSPLSQPRFATAFSKGQTAPAPALVSAQSIPSFAMLGTTSCATFAAWPAFGQSQPTSSTQTTARNAGMPIGHVPIGAAAATSQQPAQATQSAPGSVVMAPHPPSSLVMYGGNPPHASIAWQRTPMPSSSSHTLQVQALGPAPQSSWRRS